MSIHSFQTLPNLALVISMKMLLAGLAMQIQPIAANISLPMVTLMSMVVGLMPLEFRLLSASVTFAIK